MLDRVLHNRQQLVPLIQIQRQAMAIQRKHLDFRLGGGQELGLVQVMLPRTDEGGYFGVRTVDGGDDAVAQRVQPCARLPGADAGG